MHYVVIALLAAVLFGGCTQEQTQKKTKSAMKCGAGKCGANMFDGNKALAKKRANILKQLRKGDPRVECVTQAKTTKTLYDCVRNPMTGRLSLKCGSSKNDANGMRCGAGKCGKAMQKPKQPIKKRSTMKCAAGKCGGSETIREKKEKKKKQAATPPMRCGAGKCGT